MDQALHFLFREAVARHDLEQQGFIIIRDIPQVRGQPMELIVPLALDRFASRELEPAGDDVPIGHTLEIRS